jgi:uncharacterized membrane protein YbjE (DUF340 family)
MRGSLLLFLMFSFGVLAGFLYPELHYTKTDISVIILFLLMFFVGLNLGSSKELIDILKKTDFQILAIPLITITGTSIGMLVFSFLQSSYSLKELLAVGSGFGYYSLSSMIISKISGEMLAVVALLSNIFREIISIILTPLMVKYLGAYSPIVSAGATSMDTALPVIAKFSGPSFILSAVFNGIVLTLLLPFLVVFFLNL